MNSAALYRKFTGTAGIMFLSRVIVMLSGIIFARYLGPEQYGLYGYTLSIIVILTMPVIAGLPNLIVRELAQFQLESKLGLAKGIINWSRFYVILGSIIIMIGAYVALYFNLFEGNVAELLWIALLLIPIRGLLTQQSAILNGLNKPVLSQLPVTIFAPLVTLVILLLCILFEMPLSGLELIFINVLASFIAFIWSAMFLFRITNNLFFKNKVIYKIKSWHRSLLPFTLITLITTFNAELASILLGWFVGFESVAYFKIAVQSVGVIGIGLVAINVVIMPNISRLYKSGDLKSTQELLTKSVRLSVLITIPPLVLLILFGDKLIGLLFGDEYIVAYPMVVILAMGQLVSVCMGSVALVLNMTGHEGKSLKSVLVSLFVSLILYILILPIYGGLGASIVVSICLVLLNILMVFDVVKSSGLKTWLR
ncbi:oligosaccharide flippase family protein [Vibrio splendidus]